MQNEGGGHVELFTKDEDHLYIGQQMPFNNFYVWMDTPSTSTSGEMVVEYFDGVNWVESVDLIDGTNGLQQSGCVQFVPDKDHSWQVVDDPSQLSGFALSTLKIYNLYWVRVKLSGTCSAGTKIKRIAYAFCMSSDLKTHKPDIDSYLVAWGGASKADWTKEILAASEQVVIDLKARGLITHPGQILLMDDVTLACQYRAVANILFGLGPSFDDTRTVVEKAYSSSLSIKRFTIDVNRSGRIEPAELALTVGTIER
jgi:hypothetical protein